MPQPGEVWIADIPFTSGTHSKLRPVLVLWTDAGWQLYHDRADKDWGVIDCISFTIMQERNIVEALTGDRHFQQAGFVALL
jgi:predicted nucleic acid-binding protein